MFEQELFEMYKNITYINRNKVIEREQDFFQEVIDNPQKKYLNLGCGERILPGFINVDKYYQDSQVINFDIFQLPFEDNTIDGIFCAHVLEHLPFRHARLAIIEWARVLKGFLYLGIPDVELIFEYFKVNDDIDMFLVTLFGFQTDPGNRGEDLNYPVNDGHFHKCGFTKKMIQDQLEVNGFVIDELYNYDGWGTPSIWVKAHI